MTKPVWYLDVDGVLNVVTNKRPEDIPEENWMKGIAKGYSIHWDTRVIDFINKVHEEDLVDIIWLTTWEDSANEFISPLLGLPQFPLPSHARHEVEVFTKMYQARGWWKWDVIQKDLEQREVSSDIIWTDDDLEYGYASQPSIRQHVEKRWKRALGISPDTLRGLTLEHLAEIEKRLHPLILLDGGLAEG